MADSVTDSAADGAQDHPDGTLGDAAGRGSGGGSGDVSGVVSARRGRLLVAAAVVLVLVVLAARGTGGSVVEEVLSLPATGTVRPELLANGTPVFVVHTNPIAVGDPPTVDVIQAFTTELEGPITELVGWCARGQQLVAGHHGPLYDFRGRRLPSAVSGRLPADAVRTGLTALDDLVHRTSEALAGRVAEGEPLRVGGIQRLQSWQVQDRPQLDPVVAPEACRVGADDSPVVDHGFLAASVAADRAGWQITTGWLVITPGGEVSWCDAEPVVEASAAGPGGGTGGWVARCAHPRPDVVVGFDFDPADVGDVPVVMGGPLAVRITDGVLQRVAVMPASTWQGSSLRGTERYVGNFVDLDTDRAVAAVRGVAGGGGELCLADLPGPMTSQAVGTSIPVSSDTAFFVDGEDDPDQIAAAPAQPTDGARVDVVIDAVTCRALSIADAE